MLVVPAANPFHEVQIPHRIFIDEIHSFIAFATAHTVFTFLSNPPYYTCLKFTFLFLNIWAAYGELA